MERTILTGAMLIDGSGASPAAGRAVVVENGRIGLAADLLAVADNPAERIQALDEVRLVMAQGRMIVNRA